MRILVLGAYGLIGLPVSKRLLGAGHEVVGLARSFERGRALLPEAEWIGADLAALTKAPNWFKHLDGIDVVVNASGVLQAGLGDNVAATQCDAIVALIDACEHKQIARLVQISAPDVASDASTEFYRSKARADEALKSSTLNWVVLRPGLVVSAQSYGGTGLLRMLAAMPYVQPVFLPDAPVQTISVNDVAEVVLMSVGGDLDRQDIDLVEGESHRLIDIILEVRRWLGFPPPKYILTLPRPIGRAVGKLADVASWLGWKSALRSTAMNVLTDGVRGDAKKWSALRGEAPSSFVETLRALPSTRQERLSARASLVYPVLVMTLSLFWFVSGVMGLIQLPAATATLADVLPSQLALGAVIGGSMADIIVGLLIAFRPTIRRGCLASLFLASAYLVASAFLTPALWADPLGPMVKVFPALALALAVMALSEDR